jgi:hypothetical protein
MILVRTNEVDQDFKEKMVWWWAKVNTSKDYWVRFALCWIIFDAYLTEISQCDRDRDKLDYFYKNKNDFKKNVLGKWDSLSAYILGLKKLSPIFDMRPNSTKVVYLNDGNNTEDVFNFIYQIRCNLFHGSKNIKNPKDAELVRYADKFLRASIECWMNGY